MAGIYPDDESLNIYGQPVTWPGMDPDTGKFTNGDFADPLKKPSFIPAESINLILDNLSELIKSMSEDGPNNQAIDQLVKLFTSAATPNKGIVRDENGRAQVESPTVLEDIVNLGYLNNSQVGNIIHTMINETKFMERRYLPLDGQPVLIEGIYQPLFDAVYPGDAAQSSTQAFYKCDADGTRNSGGLYFKLPNANGRVIRGTGQGDQILDKDKVPIDDTYYQGGSVGDSINDAIRNIWGGVKDFMKGYDELATGAFSYFKGDTVNRNWSGISGDNVRQFDFSSDRVVPVADWNRDASISARICIIY